MFSRVNSTRSDAVLPWTLKSNSSKIPKVLPKSAAKPTDKMSTMHWMSLRKTQLLSELRLSVRMLASVFSALKAWVR